MANKHVNVIVVCTGSRGGIGAKEHDINGITVVLFELREWPNYEEHPND